MKTSKVFRRLVLVLLLVLCFVLTVVFAQFSMDAPLNRDEAALGYNASLLAQTGKDEWQRSWPLTLESFGDYKLIGYPAVVASFLSIFPASNLIVRLPSFIALLLLVYFLYIAAKKLQVIRQPGLVSLFLATTPVIIFFGMHAFEAMLGLALLVGGLVGLFFYPATKVKALATTCLLLSMLVYNTPFLLMPFIGLAFVFWNGWKNKFSWFFAGSLAAGWIVLYYYFSSLLDQKGAITIFSDLNYTLRYGEFRSQFPPLLRPVLGSQAAFYGPLMLERFLLSFSPQFLLWHQYAHPWHFIPNFGHLTELIWITGLLGMLVGVRHILLHRFTKVESRELLLLFFLLASSLFPAVITVDAPHATRSLLFFIIWTIFAAIGTEFILRKLRLKSLVLAKQFVAGILLVLVLVNTLFLQSLLDEQPLRAKRLFQSGLVTTLQNERVLQTQQQVAVVDPGGYQYIHLAWDALVTPEEFYSTNIKQEPNWFGFRYGQQLLNVHFINQLEDATEDELVFSWNSDAHLWETNQSN